MYWGGQRLIYWSQGINRLIPLAHGGMACSTSLATHRLCHCARSWIKPLARICRYALPGKRLIKTSILLHGVTPTDKNFLHQKQQNKVYSILFCPFQKKKHSSQKLETFPIQIPHQWETVCKTSLYHTQHTDVKGLYSS